MADLEVIFASNAPQYEREIDGATASTKQAELATDKLTKSQERLSRSFKQVQADAKVIRNAMSQLTGGNGNLSRMQAESAELSKRRILLTSIGKQAIQDARLLDGIGGGSTKKSPFLKFLSAMGQSGSLIGRGLGIGGGLGAAVAGLVVLNKTMEIANYVLDRNKQAAQAAAEAHIRLAANIRAANEAQGQTGLSAARSQGQGIKALTAKGGGLLDLSNIISQKYGISPEEAQKATLAAQRRFGNQAPIALEEAGRAFATGLGPNLTEGIQGISRNSLRTPSRAASRLIGQDITSAEGNIAQSGLARSVQEIERVEAQRGVAGQGMIQRGVGAARGELAAAVNPLSKIMLDQFNKQQEQLDVLKSIADSQGIIASAFDRIINPQTNAAVTYNRAASAPGQ